MGVMFLIFTLCGCTDTTEERVRRKGGEKLWAAMCNEREMGPSRNAF